MRRRQQWCGAFHFVLSAANVRGAAKSLLFVSAGVLVTVCGVGAETQADFADASSLASELHRLEQSLNEKNIQELSDALPPAWYVQTNDGNYRISTAPLRAILDQASKNRSSTVADGQKFLGYLAVQLEAYSGVGPSISGARENLERILARPEFAGNGPPSAWDRLRERIAAWVNGWMKRVFELVREYPAGGSIVFWLAMVGAVLALGWRVVRFWHRDPYKLGLSGSPRSFRARKSEQWLSAIRTASNGGDFRSAIHCAYWAGIARLEERGALPVEVTHTPREYLRLVSGRLQDRAADPGVINPLRTLTARLERFWYASATAAADDLRPCLESLEALGCKVD